MSNYVRDPVIRDCLSGHAVPAYVVYLLCLVLFMSVKCLANLVNK